MKSISFRPALFALAAIPGIAGAWHGDRHGDGPPSGRYIVDCASIDHRDRYCPADTRGGVRLLKRDSKAACVPGHTWGYDRGGIWVTGGCRARFEVGGGYRGGGYGRGHGGYDDGYGGQGYGHYGPRVVRCESVEHRPRFCRVPGGVRGVRVERRLSKAGCDYGYSWGFLRDGIWVERGCRADFLVF
ncbi:DUF3011 domain-containing protein [Arenimonas fontis]|uniref:DUF3011 domain-containing protein n=1 Tax=Arenimonas fontis TaxID=2608255 RepID=A0A5B2ZGE6_9GAMM|nr:DUF3011 domain-containing protein [Arenimonas fontis]KAA2286141.1 DUF3011 domain-containing protein [Arenimonas fontis]